MVIGGEPLPTINRALVAHIFEPLLAAERQTPEGFCKKTSLRETVSWSSLRIYVYHLPDEYHRDIFLHDLQTLVPPGCSGLLAPCIGEEHRAAKQFLAGHMMLRRLLCEGLLVDDGGEADLYLVPYLAGHDCHMQPAVTGGSVGTRSLIHWPHGPPCSPKHCYCGANRASRLFAHLRYYTDSAQAARHLFISGHTAFELPPEIQAQPLLLHLGPAYSRRGFSSMPGHVVLPSFSPEPALLAAAFGASESQAFTVQRPIFVFYAATLYHRVRAAIFEELIALRLVLGPGRVVCHNLTKDLASRMV